jgi:hypothetical protein
MANQPVVGPAARSKDAVSGTPLSVRSLPVTQQKKASRFGEDISYLCSAYLAERGCLSPKNPPRQTSA